MLEVATLPFEMFVNFASQAWDVAGVPMILGTLIAGITQKVKLSPTLFPMVAIGNKWFVRGFVAVLAVVIQISFDLITGHNISWFIVQDLFMNYFAATLAYTHMFKTINPVK